MQRNTWSKTHLDSPFVPYRPIKVFYVPKTFIHPQISDSSIIIVHYDLLTKLGETIPLVSSLFRVLSLTSFFENNRPTFTLLIESYWNTSS